MSITHVQDRKKKKRKIVDPSDITIDTQSIYIERAWSCFKRSLILSEDREEKNGPIGIRKMATISSQQIFFSLSLSLIRPTSVLLMTYFCRY